ncbi:MAG: hypothetical protein U0J83_08915 [Bulleidia sp.]|nr:hypothetical protein [Bulleidia sp.]
MKKKDLCGIWVCTECNGKIRFNPFYVLDGSQRYSYTIKEDGNQTHIQYGVEDILYHEEEGIPILSKTIMEYDGRGLIILEEYVKERDEGKISISQLKQKRNDVKPVPMAMEVKE